MTIRRLIAGVLPYALVRAVQRRRARGCLAAHGTEWARQQQAREQRIEGFMRQVPTRRPPPYSYTDSIDFLVSLGCDREQVVGGSMPEASLAAVTDILREASPGALLKILHIGNFVGVSLAYLTCFAVANNPESVVVSVDPNVCHRGIERPLEMAVRLLCRYGLQRNSMVLVGYSLEKSVSNDGLVLDGRHDPYAEYEREAACEHQLDNLAGLGLRDFDAAVLDGNHESGYLAREIEGVSRCLRDQGVLVLDDVSATWANIKAVFERAKAHMTERFTDGRVGVLFKAPPPACPPGSPTAGV